MGDHGAVGAHRVDGLADTVVVDGLADTVVDVAAQRVPDTDSATRLEYPDRAYPDRAYPDRGHPDRGTPDRGTPSGARRRTTRR